MNPKPAQSAGDVPATGLPWAGSAELDGVVGRLSAVTAQNLPLPAALLACAEESCSSTDARELRRLAHALERGTSLEEALRTGSSATRGMATLVAAGLKTCQLPQLLKSYLVSSRHNRELWRGFWISLSYPLIVLAAAASLMLVIFIAIVPMFKSMFNDFGIQLPWMTQALVTASDLAASLWWFHVAILSVAASAMVIASWLPLGRIWQYVLLFGYAASRAGLSEFCSLLSVFVSSGAPLHEGLEVISKTSRSYPIRDLSRKLSRRLQAGLTPEVAARDPEIPVEIAQAFRWSEQQDQFAIVLRNQAQALAAEARIQFRVLVLFLEPVIIVGLGLIAGFLIIGLFSPLIRLLNDLS